MGNSAKVIGLVVVLLIAGFWWVSSSPSKEDLNQGKKELAQIENTEEGTAETQSGMTYGLNIEQSNFNFTGGVASHDQNGRFASWNTQISLEDENDLSTMNLDVLIDMNSMETGNQKLTDHLKAEDFFETATYPTATFKSTSVEGSGDAYQITGDLNLRGVVKSITIPATVTKSGDSISLNSQFTINRVDFGVSYEGKSNDLVKDDFELDVALVAVKK